MPVCACTHEDMAEWRAICATAIAAAAAAAMRSLSGDVRVCVRVCILFVCYVMMVQSHLKYHLKSEKSDLPTYGTGVHNCRQYG